MRLINFNDLINAIEANKDVSYLASYGINYIEQLEALLPDVCRVDKQKISKISNLTSITSCDNPFIKGLYECTKLKTTQEINSHLKELVEKSMNENPIGFLPAISVRPIIYSSIPRASYAYLAGLIENACDTLEVTPPKWINEPFFFLEYPYLSGKDISIRSKTIYAFTKRNLFIQN